MDEQSNFFSEKSLWILSALILAILLVPIVFYVATFGSNELSGDTANWGTFGDFLGGVLNPFLSLLTLVATIYIAYVVSGHDTKRNEKALAFERSRFLTELRESEYRRITSLLYEPENSGFYVVRREMDKDELYEKYRLATMQIAIFNITSKHLFPFLEDKESEGYKAWDELYSVLRRFNLSASWCYSKGRARQSEEEEAKLEEAVQKNNLAVMNARSKFSEIMQRFILAEMQ
ncbi:hypothetical protein ACFSC6_00015 [Rufibacter sediminis]|uniref:hypothetical protein n=1 Tax=Rufibacter sediminis TaxID=2762756 RepID=UPI00210DA289|nr:hypothetical protein [Rufibacter sediminis]